MIASGSYRYWRDGALQAVSEPWQCLRNVQGLLLRGQRLVDGRPVLELEAQYVEGACVAMQLRWHTADAARGVRYRHGGETLQWACDDETVFRVLELPGNNRLFPLLRAATGPLLLQLARAPGTVILPCIRTPSADQFLHPLLSERRASLLDAQLGQEAHYLYQGGEYGEAGCECWLNPQGLLLRYRWQSTHGDWDVRLEDLWMAPEFAGF